MKKYEKKTRLRLYFLAFLLFIVTITAGAAFFVKSAYFTSWLKSYLSSDLSKILQKKVTIKKIQISFFSPQILLGDVRIKGVAAVGRVSVSFGPVDILRRRITIYDVGIAEPKIKILIKNNKIANYKEIALVEKYLAEKHAV